MARIGSIDIGGHATLGTTGNPMLCGAAFDLAEEVKADFIYAPSGTPWEVETRAGQSRVVARTSLTLTRQEVLSQGLEWSQRCLDLLSFERRVHLLLANPGDKHVLLFFRDGTLVLQHGVVANLHTSVSVEAVVTDREGRVKLHTPPPSVWVPALRYHRLSQASRDLYEAYRNLFLGLEALLGDVCPKKVNEREREWLLRAMSEVGRRVNLGHFVPEGILDAPAYLIGTQYDAVRCRLFHAKGDARGTALDIPNPEEVGVAYERLVRLWRDIARVCLSARCGGEGGMTYAGFRMMMEEALSRGLSMYFTDDPSPAGKDDTEVSPLGMKVCSFKDAVFHGETDPGRVTFLGSQPVSELPEPPAVHRVCAKAGETLLLVSCVEDGLEMTDVDVFESLQTIRLRNRDLPRVAFGE